MCGIFGMAGNGIYHKHLKAFRELGIVSQLRGTDSSGVFQIDTCKFRDTEKKGFVHKEATDFTNFNAKRHSKDIPVRNFMDDQMCNLYIGHVRAATVGNIVDENAHPFDFPFIVGAHNGTLVDLKYQHAEKTDSEMMFADINERGIEEVLPELARNSAFAISMYNRYENRMILTRNSQRPLWIAHCKLNRVVFWASEGWMLQAVLGRNDIEIFEMYQVKPDIILKFDPASVKEGTNRLFEIEDIKYTHSNQVKPTTIYGGNRSSAWNFRDDKYWEEFDWDQAYPKAETRVEAGSKTPELPLLITKETNILEFRGQPPSGLPLPSVGDTSLPVINKPRTSRIEYVPCMTCGCSLNPLERYYATEYLVDGEEKYECETCEDTANAGKPVTHQAEKEKVN